ncbi:MAG TPA: hypothetical protein PLE99_10690 [Candidatus Thiothrix moscowensis]|uniref:hypothetical protein n=1 Tax=unclassified Thiothrix TaxID=2636184 RepID=UPI001A24731B|nr:MULTISPECIES: hypothetical protein [unclassified Thiothrix]MBJ6611396.1 hypothetical protein [Candidatus Thiothrix moscowensis]HRJ53226.1 hypothetical protein [Candidatus Thiothrix moscowensis]HRJ93204.1 hypothetical protein [Candidatus Thiothrix moscowensis]
MRMRHFIFSSIHITLLTLMIAPVQAEDPAYIAGTNPAERPANAPVVTEVKKDAAWYSAALTGVEQPYPASLRFMENQGNWYSPFTHAGMLGPYDIRGWHKSD